MVNNRVRLIVFLFFIVSGLFINTYASDILVNKLEYNIIQKPIKELSAIPESNSAFPILDFQYNRSPGTDTLRNHDRLPSFYYLADSTYYVTRLTMPKSAASACTVKAIRFGLYRPRSSLSTLCSLFIWRDTVVAGFRRPGFVRLRGLYIVPSWTSGYWSWITVTLTTPIVFQPNENFWIGFFSHLQDVNQLADGSENLDTTRNEIKLPGQNWRSNRYDFLQEAVVSYTPVDSNVGVSKIDNVSKIVKGNTSVNIRSTIKNFGRTTISAGIPVTLSITGSTTSFETTAYTTSSIGPNGITKIDFPWQFPNVSGDYEINVWTNLVNDPIRENDTMRFGSFVYTRGFLETFMADFPPTGWSVFNFNGNRQWTSASRIFYADSISARILWDPVPYAPNNDWLITPRFKTMPQDSFIFWYRAASSEFYETLLVRINNTSNVLDTLNFSIIIDTLITNNTDWQRRTIPFNRVLTDSARVYVALHYPCYNNFYIAIDDVIMPELDTIYDFFPVSIDAPKIPIVTDSSYIPSATYRNNSISSEPIGLYVFYQILGNTIFYRESILVGIAGGNGENVKFPVFTPTVAETVDIEIWTQYPFDDNFFNDTLSQKIFIAPKYQIPPYHTTFNENWGPEGNNPPFGGWQIIAGGSETSPPIWNSNDWHKDTLRVSGSLREVAMVYYSPVENHFDRLISPRFNCSIPGIYTLSYWHWYRDYDPLITDSGVVLISTNGGNTWPIKIARYSNTSDVGDKIFTITPYVAGYKDVRFCFLYGAYNEYWWAIDDFSVTWIPLAPELIYPTDGLEIAARGIRFSWNAVPGASVYEIQIAYDSLFQILFDSDTVTTTSDSIPLASGTYYWRVRAGTPFGFWSQIRRLKILPLPSGWFRLDNITAGARNVKDGGALVFCALDSNIYALKGNNTREFYAYNPVNSLWSARESIGLAPQSNKKVKKGAALCFGDTLIYALKGNSTSEFWVYSPRTNTWTQKKNTPIKIKAGSGLVYLPGTKLSKLSTSTIRSESKTQQNSDKIYLLVGSSKNREFYTYLVDNDSWYLKNYAPCDPQHSKAFKDGSALVYDEETKIYALKGGAKVNEFYSYDIIADSWSLYPGDTIPQKKDSLAKAFKIKSGGALAFMNGDVYAIKGGGCVELWRYSPQNKGIWTMIDTIPYLDKKAVPKTGAALTAGLGNIYLLKGNNTLEFWKYVPPVVDYKFQIPNSKFLSNIQTERASSKIPDQFIVAPNPCRSLVNISYTVTEPNYVSIKVYDLSGQLVNTLQNGFMPRGKFNLKFSVRNLAAGVYFINFNNSQENQITKLIIQ